MGRANSHLARWLALAAHAGQVDRFNGEPYTEHLRRVAERVQGDDDAVAVAWLHDLLEDTPVEASELHTCEFPAAVVSAVEQLTRDRAVVYADYIDRLVASGNKLALLVKLADLRDHLRPEAQERVPASLRGRYERALSLLEAEARRRGL